MFNNLQRFAKIIKTNPQSSYLITGFITSGIYTGCVIQVFGYDKFSLNEKSLDMIVAWPLYLFAIAFTSSQDKVYIKMKEV